jgi:hypothetical protein
MTVTLQPATLCHFPQMSELWFANVRWPLRKPSVTELLVPSVAWVTTNRKISSGQGSFPFVLRLDS